jgi:hypothetical protein
MLELVIRPRLCFSTAPNSGVQLPGGRIALALPFATEWRHNAISLGSVHTVGTAALALKAQDHLNDNAPQIHRREQPINHDSSPNRAVLGWRTITFVGARTNHSTLWRVRHLLRETSIHPDRRENVERSSIRKSAPARDEWGQRLPKQHTRYSVVLARPNYTEHPSIVKVGGCFRGAHSLKAKECANRVRSISPIVGLALSTELRNCLQQRL